PASRSRCCDGRSWKWSMTTGQTPGRRCRRSRSRAARTPRRMTGTPGTGTSSGAAAERARAKDRQHVAPPSTQASRPGRLLALLVVLVIVMLAAIVGKDALSPESWHKNFKIGLGLDLSSGSTVTLRAVSPKKGVVPSQASMKEASSIMLDRVNGAGFTGAQVQQQGSDIIPVTVPGKGSQQVVSLVGTTAQLRFRQVLLEASNYPASTKPSPAASPSPSASAKASSSSNGSGQSASAKSLAAAGTAAQKARPASSASPKPSTSASPAARPTASPPVLSSTKDASGNASLVSSNVAALFDKLNCDSKNWQQEVYQDNAAAWDDPNSQIVSCDGSAIKYALDVAKVTGPMITKPSAGLGTNGGWQVNFNLTSQGTNAFGALTSSMYSKYYAPTGSPSSPLDQFAIVLDGKVVSAPDVVSAITGGSSEITGTFT